MLTPVTPTRGCKSECFQNKLQECNLSLKEIVLSIIGDTFHINYSLPSLTRQITAVFIQKRLDKAKPLI